MAKLGSCVLSALLFSACAGLADGGVEAEAPEAPVVIATLQMQAGEVTISSTELGVRYDVRSSSGMSQSQLTLAELEAVAPEIANVVRFAAGSASGAFGPHLDASRGPQIWAGVIP